MIDDRHHARLQERPDHVARVEEGVEVVVVDAGGLAVDHGRAEPGRENDMSTATQYSGMTTITPATTRVEARYAIERMPITSSASISSLIRIAPSCAVAPAPMVAARAMPAVSGAMIRTLT